MAPRRSRMRIAAIVVGAMSALVACGQPATLFPYTPAVGVNAQTAVVKVRNLVVVATPGSGFLSGSLAAQQNTSLIDVTGSTLKSGGEVSTPLVVSRPVLVNVPGGSLVTLTDRALIRVTATDLTPGLLTRLTLSFSQGDPVTLDVPVVDATHPDFATLSPTPTPSPTAHKS